jgi:aminopeptidase N
MIDGVKPRRRPAERTQPSSNPNEEQKIMSYPVGRLSLATCCLVLTVPTWAEEPYSFDKAPGRLPKEVVPIDYTIDIKPDTKNLTLSGHESVLLQFRSATATVQFNSLNETLHDVRLDGRAAKSVVSDDAQQLTTVTLSAPAPVGQHKLTFAYTAKIEEQPHGLFTQSYRGHDGAQGQLLSTQMEATDARRMFPCWDEPAFRATFQLQTTVPAAWQSISNMPIARRVVHGKLATTTFARSPKMPSYLIEFTAGDLAQISAAADNIRFAIWAVRGQENGGATALANAQQILADYNDYFGYRFPLPKLDSLAIPGGFSGAMENWGAITYNEQLLLLTPVSTVGDRQAVFSVQAHEMAHQWNGDLVTMAWWDDIWLNESFASWMAAKETALRNPDWKWWEEQDDDKEDAMSADARASSHAIQQHVTDELQATNAFDPQITYSKGQAILRMFEAYLGPDVFRNGVRSYIKARAFSNATTADLWNGLSLASSRDVAAIAADWTEQAGFPLVALTARCDAAGVRTITLSQKRFLLSGTEAASSHWKVPLQIRAGAAGTPQSVLLSREDQPVEAGRCDEPLSVNADAIGFYRATYDPATLATNTKSFDRLPDGDRIALLDDQWALVESGIAQLPTYLALASSMGADLDTRAWGQIAHALETIEYAERGTARHDAFAAYGRSILRPAFERLGWDAKPGEIPAVYRLRRALIGDLGIWGDPAVIDEARKRFSAFVIDHKAITPDYQTAILSVVAHYADAATFDQLHAIAKAATEQSEVRRYYSALMQVHDPQLAERVVQIALSSEIPPQSESLRLQLVFILAREQPQLSWNTFSNNSERLLAPQVTFASLVVAQFVPEIYWNGTPLSDLEAWVRAHVPAEMSSAVERGMETARFKFAEKTALVREADAYVH